MATLPTDRSVSPLRQRILDDIGGGSRARAYAASGDALAEDPACRYDPRSHG